MGHPQDLWLLKPHRRSADFSAIKLLIEEIVDAHLSAFSSALFVTRFLQDLAYVGGAEIVPSFAKVFPARAPG
jgi:hypothetical protein